MYPQCSPRGSGSVGVLYRRSLWIRICSLDSLCVNERISLSTTFNCLGVLLPIVGGAVGVSSLFDRSLPLARVTTATISSKRRRRAKREDIQAEDFSWMVTYFCGGEMWQLGEQQVLPRFSMEERAHAAFSTGFPVAHLRIPSRVAGSLSSTLDPSASLQKAVR